MLELELITQFPHEIIAADEVGRGPLCGPVVAGAVRLLVQSHGALKEVLKFLKPQGVNDSKKLSTIKRENILKSLDVFDQGFRKKGFFYFKDIEISYVTWEMDHDIIDQENILGASLRGMKEASEFLSLSKNIPTTVLIDGHMNFRWGKKQSPFNEIPLVKGDARSLLIGLASIMAKQKRDHYMKEMHEIYPQYGFNSHFGYPTKAHREAIKIHGPCDIHRKTFKGVKEYVRT
jgi:ribonuclease HII